MPRPPKARKEVLPPPPPVVIAEPHVPVVDVEFPEDIPFSFRVPKATRKVVERIVKDLWARVGPLARMSLARAVERITLSGDVDFLTPVGWDGRSIVLYIFDDDDYDDDYSYDGDGSSVASRRTLHNRLAALFAHVFVWHYAALLAAEATVAGGAPDDLQARPAGDWFRALDGGLLDNEDWNGVTQLVRTLLQMWGSFPTAAEFRILERDKLPLLERDKLPLEDWSDPS